MKKASTARPRQATLPSVHRMLELPAIIELIDDQGASLVKDAIRLVLDEYRKTFAETKASTARVDDNEIVRRVQVRVEELTAPSLKPVLNLTGTVLHTNLGRAPLPQEAIDAVALVASGASNLEYDLARGRRGDRDSHLESQIHRLISAEATTVVNNNAAAVLLVLNSLASRKEVIVSRGELIEIGGAFRLPDIMQRAGCKLCEVGTTNRTHLRDYEAAIGPRTAMILKAHTSNFSVEGFTAAVDERELAALAQKSGVPFMVDLGSGSLVDLSQFGLPREPTPSQTLANGADIVTFSGDKLLGGPQCGIVAGRADLLTRIRRNPMKRALRVDKMTIAALSVMLQLYANPATATKKIPTLRMLARKGEEIRVLAEKVKPVMAARLDGVATVDVVDCKSQVGSGAMPVDVMPSAALSIRPLTGKKGSGAALTRLTKAFRDLPLPVIGRLHDGALLFDLRCLEDQETFTQQLQYLDA